MTTELVLLSHYNKILIPELEYIEEVKTEEFFDEAEELMKRQKEIIKCFEHVDFGLGLGSVEIRIVDNLF